MTHHTIEPTAETLHGSFSRDFTPVLTIDPGDSVRFRTLDADWVLDDPTTFSEFPTRMEALGTRHTPRHPERDEGHALCGPVAVRGAKPGMMLAVHINRIVPGTWGWSFPWFYTPYERKDTIPLIMWRLDAATMTGHSSTGHTVRLCPFMGVMGMPADEPGFQVTKTPRATGGNMDCKELVAGTTLYLPIAVDGGLFSTGDGHGVQGDGEIGGTAIECPMALVDLTFDLVENPPIRTAHANTPSGWLTLGFDEDLQAACDQAVEAMAQFITTCYGVNHSIAIGLAGNTVDLHITQIVNQVKGVHALLPHGALR
jgi:acetamidase/formamidase